MSLTAAWPDRGLIHRDLMRVYIYLLIYSFFFFCSPTAVSIPLELSINSLLIKNLFCYLRSAFSSPPSLLWGECVNHYGSVRMERKTRRFEGRGTGEKERKENVGWHSQVGQREKKRRIDRWEKLAVSGGEMERRSRGWGSCSTNYRSASHWRFSIICSPGGKERSVVIVVDGYERGGYIAMDFSLSFSGRSIKRVLMGERARVRDINWPGGGGELELLGPDMYTVVLVWK